MKFVSISLSPNAQKHDIKKAVEVILNPFRYISGDAIRSLEQWFRNYFSVSYAISFNSGRSALYALLKVLHIGKNDEVILQAFTCVVVPNSIVALSAKPVYVDVLSDLTMDPKDLEKKISKKTKAIIIQHTFGIPNHMKEIMRIAKEKNIPVIEDCAHTIGGVDGSKKLGTFGSAAFFSFGRDKAFSAVFGGMAITDDEVLGKKLRAYQKNLQFPGIFWTLQQVFHPIAFSVILPTYRFLSMGKVILVIFQKAQLLSFPVSPQEKKGLFNPSFVKKLPNGLASLALFQLKRIKEFNAVRETTSQIYAKKLKHESFTHVFTQKQPLLRYPLLVNNSLETLTYLRKKGIYTGKWYSEVIDPVGTDFAKISYEKGMCPNAEKIAEHIINLPTHPKMTKENAEYIVDILTKYANKRS